MNRKRKLIKRSLVSFVILTYVIFLGFFGLIGASKMAGMDKLSELLKMLSAWSSTLAFIILFKRIYPGLELKEIVKSKFKQRINFKVVIVIISVQIFLYLATVILLPNTNFEIKISITTVSTAIYLFMWHLLWGPLGEELGWRGYMLNELMIKYSALKSALVIGGLWGFWHAPIWFTFGYTGVKLIKFCAFYLIALVAISIVITFFYRLNNNLLIPILIHQLWNFLTYGIKGEFSEVVEYTAILYLIFAIILIAINPKGVLYSKKADKMLQI